MRVNIITLLPFLLASIHAIAANSEHDFCDVGAATSRSASSWIGKDSNVEVYTVSCPTAAKSYNAREPEEDMISRQSNNMTNVCGTQCNTNCFAPSGGEPDSNECRVIADALLYAAENTGALFPVGVSPNNTVVMEYRTCKTFFLNQDLGPVAYCRSDWAALVNWLATDCSTANNAHGGNCVAQDQRWFVQVQHI